MARTKKQSYTKSKEIVLSEPNICGNEWHYVKECLDSGWVSSAGKYVDLFGKKIEKYTGTKYAVACVNGTSALQVSLFLAGVREGDEVIVPTLTFIAPVNAIAYNGATPVFTDCDDFYNMDIEKTIDFIQKETKFVSGTSQHTINRKTGNRISAIIPVHVWGNAAKLDDLIPICQERNITVVEDASESLGTYFSDGKFKGKHMGTIAKLGCLSFNGNKIITTGGGGMILTNDKNLAEKARYLTTQAKDEPLSYIHNEIGYNFRLTNVQAALGVAQFEQLPKFLKIKKNIYKKYIEALENINGLEIAPVPEYAENNHWLNLLQVDHVLYGRERDTIMNRMKDHRVQTRPIWKLNHLQKPYRNCQTDRIEKALELVNKSVCLPSSTNLRDDEMKKIIHILNE